MQMSCMVLLLYLRVKLKTAASMVIRPMKIKGEMRASADKATIDSKDLKLPRQISTTKGSRVATIKVMLIPHHSACDQQVSSLGACLPSSQELSY